MKVLRTASLESNVTGSYKKTRITSSTSLSSTALLEVVLL